MNDARDHAPIIDTATTRLVLWKVRLYRSPLRVAQPEQSAHDASIHQTSVLNHKVT